MPHFLLKRRKKFSINFTEISDDPISETPFWEIQRAEAIDKLVTFYSSWQALWRATVRSLGDLHLTKDIITELEFYETEQRKTILSLLASTLVAWEKDDQAAFSSAVLRLAKELRPSLTHYEPGSPDHALSLSPNQLIILQNYTKNEGISLKTTITELQRLAWHKLEFGDKVLTQSAAETLLREKLGLSFFDYIDSTGDPDFHGHGFFPAFLQESTDFGL